MCMEDNVQLGYITIILINELMARAFHVCQNLLEEVPKPA